jgi:hypothetical protein
MNSQLPPDTRAKIDEIKKRLLGRDHAESASESPGREPPPSTTLTVAKGSIKGRQTASPSTVQSPSEENVAASSSHSPPAQLNRAARRRLQHNLAEIERTLRRLCRGGDVIEIRALHCRPRNITIAGYFDAEHLAEAAREVVKLDAQGIYITLNPVKPALLARFANRLAQRPATTTTDADIDRRDRVLIDFDPDRPSGISASDPEKLRASERAEQCRQYLADCGWLAPVVADSGNGTHLLYSIALPNDADSCKLVEHALKALALFFSDDLVKVDTTTFNAARITKLYGTVAAKGDDTAGRPHRLSGILDDPGLRPDEIVTVRQLKALAALLPEESPRVRDLADGRGEFDIEKWIR